MIEIKNVTKSYGNFLALKNANITIQTGSIFGLVGINGSGKSTLLRMIAGVMQADEGCILVDGEDVYENEGVKKGIFFLPDEPFYTSNINGADLRELYSTFYSFNEERFTSFLEKFKLDRKKPLRSFSKGMKRQMYIALAIACSPKYLLLDEAFDGLDPLARLECKRALIELKESGTTVIISSHSLRELQDICDSYGIIDNKEFATSGDLNDTLENIHKFQVAFEHGINADDFTFEYMSLNISGRIAVVIARGDSEEILKEIAKLNPLIIDELPLDFEEFFIAEVKHRGYLQ